MSIQLPPFLIAFLLLCLKAEIAQNTKSELGLFTESTLEKEKIIFRTANDHLKAVDISTGKITWDISPKSLNEQTDKLKNRLVKGADGSLYFTSASSNSSFIHKLPLTIQKLVEKSPFLMEGFYILGSKKTSLLIINIKNGNILFEENIFSKNQNFLEKSLLNDDHLIYAVQSDFFVKIFSFESGKSWNSSLSELRVLEANSVFSNDFYVEMQSDGKTALKNKNKEVVWETFSGIFDAKMTTVYVTDNNKLLKIPIFYGPENNALNKNKNSVAEYLSYLKNIDKNGVPSRVPAIKGKKDELALEEKNYFPKLTFKTMEPDKKIKFFAKKIIAEAIAFVLFFVGVLTIFIFLKKRKLLTEKETPKNQIKQKKRNDDIKINFDEILGRGSNGTIIFGGMFNGRKVAVKRLLKAAFRKQAETEVDMLLDLDAHPNVLSYYAKDEDEHFLYIVLEKCKYNISEALVANIMGDKNIFNSKISSKSNKTEKQKLKAFVRGILKGVRHLHSMNIVHSDLKPQNILVSSNNTAKVADMGLSRRLEVDQSEFNTAAKGSSGWQSPEVLCDGRKTKAIDIFSLGCIIFYILTNGHHPFDDDPLNRNFEVATNKDELPKGLLNLPQGCSVAPEAVHLVENMLKRDPDSRLRISDTLLHPFFWAEEKCLRFLCAVSNRFEKESADSAARALLESAAKQVLGDSWKCKIDKALISDVGRFRKYDFTKIKDLLRIIRNKAFHHNEIPKELKVLIGKYPNGFYNYFNIRFPRLLMYSYLAVGAVCSDEGAFAPFFGGVSDHYRKLLTKSARISVRDWYPWIFD